MPARSSSPACSTNGVNSCSNAHGSPGASAVSGLPSRAGRCSAASIQMASSTHAGRRRGRFAANGGKSRQHLGERQSIPLQPPAKQRPVAAGARTAPRGQTSRGAIGILLLTRQRLEIVGQELVNGRRTNGQALVKGIGPTFFPIGLHRSWAILSRDYSIGGEPTVMSDPHRRSRAGKPWLRPPRRSGFPPAGSSGRGSAPWVAYLPRMPAQRRRDAPIRPADHAATLNNRTAPAVILHAISHRALTK